MSKQTQAESGATLFSIARRLLHSWWHGDRIRVSPTAGKLLRLRPPCCLHLDEQWVEVVDRTIQEGERAVVYGCRTRTGRGTLLVKLAGTATDVAVEWREGARVVRLEAMEVEVFSK